MDEYRSRKLLDRYLEPVASQFDLTFPEIRLLLYLSHLKQPVSRRELSDYTNMSRRSLALYLQKLAARGYIRIQESREKKGTGSQTHLLDAAGSSAGGRSACQRTAGV